MLNTAPYNSGYFGLGDLYPGSGYSSTLGLVNPEATEVIVYEQMNRAEVETQKNAQAEVMANATGNPHPDLTMKHILFAFIALIAVVSILHL